jgi:hypothetical protein
MQPSLERSLRHRDIRGQTPAPRGTGDALTLKAQFRENNATER